MPEPSDGLKKWAEQFEKDRQASRETSLEQANRIHRLAFDAGPNRTKSRQEQQSYDALVRSFQNAGSNRKKAERQADAAIEATYSTSRGKGFAQKLWGIIKG